MIIDIAGNYGYSYNGGFRHPINLDIRTKTGHFKTWDQYKMVGCFVGQQYCNGWFRYFVFLFFFVDLMSAVYHRKLSRHFLQLVMFIWHGYKRLASRFALRVCCLFLPDLIFAAGWSIHFLLSIYCFCYDYLLFILQELCMLMFLHYSILFFSTALGLSPVWVFCLLL